MANWLTLGEAAAVVKELTGRRISANSVYRWWREGVAGVKLKCMSPGGRLMTTREAIESFSVDVAEARRQKLISRQVSPDLIIRVRGRKPRDRKAVERALDEIGI